ncbi:copper-binding protein [Variovorax sp. PBL-E5]|uniref:copper-binding protein n=1 Tax=Variovorax sp. PBL-E5 TaxID=434014 RepID=UPI001315C481|nr:copper-binding protein [Variovorax sp. PBL-E5]VTU32945.1 periplasmic copper-binding protein [Variovorax sp. PBL-E5]
MQKPIGKILAATLLALAGMAHAQAPDLSDGEVRKVEKDRGLLTLRHGPLKNLDMPGMTMMFKVRDPGMLDAVHVGDKVHFKAEMVDGSLTVTQIEPAR